MEGTFEIQSWSKQYSAKAITSPMMLFSVKHRGLKACYYGDDCFNARVKSEGHFDRRDDLIRFVYGEESFR